MSAKRRAAHVSRLRLARSRTLVFTFQMDTVQGYSFDQVHAIMLYLLPKIPTLPCFTILGVFPTVWTAA